MRKVHIKKVYILILIVVLMFLLIGSFIINNRKLINNILGIQIEQEEITPLFSYFVYDNQDEKNIKVLITVNSEDGIDYVKNPDGNKIYGNGRSSLNIDYIVEKGVDYKFEIKELNKQEIEQMINVNNETTKETSLGINVLNNIVGYKEIKFEDKININDFDKVYYKINENGEWIESTELSTTDYDLVQNGFVEEDNTITLYAKIVNSKTNYTVTVKGDKISVNTTQVSENIQANSLIEAINSEDIQTGKYKVTVSDEVYNLKVYNINENLEVNLNAQLGIEEDVATASEYAQNMVVLKVNGDLTVNEGAKLTSYTSKNGYGGTKGMMIYCTGTITNNGEISMTARGAKAEGQNVYMWQNNDNTYEYVPILGASGGISARRANGNKGEDGTNRSTGGGGSGGSAYGNASGKGASGTSYSGGTGGGGSHGPAAYQGSENGGAGGNGTRYNSSGGENSGGGAGNPGGKGIFSYWDGLAGNAQNGTGGLLIICTNNFINNSKITSQGANGGIANTGGGSSGGGSINIFYKQSYESNGIYNVNGGKTVGNSNLGGAGGTGSISVGNISTGTYESTYTNY